MTGMSSDESSVLMRRKKVAKKGPNHLGMESAVLIWGQLPQWDGAPASGKECPKGVGMVGRAGVV